MPFEFGDKKSVFVTVDGKKKKIYKKEYIDSFDLSCLKIGKFNEKSDVVRCICAVFDLEGFTHFCSQTEPELYAAMYLKDFFDWLFAKIRAETISEEIENSYRLYHELPFYSKFLGDGVLFVWDTNGMSEMSQHNLIISLSSICDDYEDDLYKRLNEKYVEIPRKLRCGVAKGSVYSIGDRKDFIGPCINLASRLQSLPGVKFVFSRKGFNPEEKFSDFKKYWTSKKVSIRGYAFEELIVLDVENFNSMSEADKQIYKNP